MTMTMAFSLPSHVEHALGIPRRALKFGRPLRRRVGFPTHRPPEDRKITEKRHIENDIIGT